MDIAENRTLSTDRAAKPAGGRMKFVIGGLLILAAIVYLIWTSATANAQYFMTVDEVQNPRAPHWLGRQLRVSGAVVGDTIKYDAR